MKTIIYVILFLICFMTIGYSSIGVTIPLVADVSLDSYEKESKELTLRLEVKVPIYERFSFSTNYTLTCDSLVGMQPVQPINEQLILQRGITKELLVAFKMTDLDSASVSFVFSCNDSSYVERRKVYFDLNSKVEVIHNSSYFVVRKLKGPKKPDKPPVLSLKPDTLSAEVMAQVYDFKLSFRESSEFEKEQAMRYLGETLSVDSRGYADYRCSIQEAWDLAKATNTGFSFINPPNWITHHELVFKEPVKSSWYLDTITNVNFPSYEVYLLYKDEVAEQIANAKLTKKERLEKDTLWTKMSERISEDGKVWERHYGERYFKEVRGYTNEELLEMYQKRQTIPNTVTRPDTYYLCLSDLSDEQLQRLDSLFQVPVIKIEGGYYHLELSPDDLSKLHRSGFKFRLRGPDSLTLSP